MKASEKLVKALESFMPHVNEDVTAIELYLGALEDVIALENSMDSIVGILNKIEVKSTDLSDDEDAEGFPPKYK